MFLCNTKKKPCFWSFANCETGAGGWSQLDWWSQVDRWSLMDRWSLVDAWSLVDTLKRFKIS